MLGEQGGVREIAGQAEAEEIEFVFGGVETAAHDFALGRRAEPCSASNTARSAVGLVPAPLGDIAAHVVNAEFVWLFRSNRCSAAPIDQILPGGGGVFPSPRNRIDVLAAAEAPLIHPPGKLGRGRGIQIRAAAELRADGLGSTTSGPFPLGFGRKSVAVRFGIRHGLGQASAVGFTVDCVNRLQIFSLATGVAKFHRVVPSDMAHRSVWSRAPGGGGKVVAVLLRKLAQGVPFPPSHFMGSDVEGLHRRFSEGRAFGKFSPRNGGHPARCGRVSGGDSGDFQRGRSATG